MKGEKKLTAHQKVMLVALAEERKSGLISWKEYTQRAKEILKAEKS